MQRGRTGDFSKLSQIYFVEKRLSEEMHDRGVGDGDSDDGELGTNRAKLDENMSRHSEQEQFGSKVKWIF